MLLLHTDSLRFYSIPNPCCLSNLSFSQSSLHRRFCSVKVLLSQFIVVVFVHINQFWFPQLVWFILASMMCSLTVDCDSNYSPNCPNLDCSKCHNLSICRTLMKTITSCLETALNHILQDYHIVFIFFQNPFQQWGVDSLDRLSAYLRIPFKCKSVFLNERPVSFSYILESHSIFTEKMSRCLAAMFSNLPAMSDIIWLHLKLSEHWSHLTWTGRWEGAQRSIWHLSEFHYYKVV